LVQPNFSEIKFSISNFLAELAPDKYGASGLPRRAPSLKLRRHSTYPDIRRNVERPTNTVSGPMTTNGHKLLSFARGTTGTIGSIGGLRLRVVERPRRGVGRFPHPNQKLEFCLQRLILALSSAFHPHQSSFGSGPTPKYEEIRLVAGMWRSEQ
jgi:hypothetical protein